MWAVVVIFVLMLTIFQCIALWAMSEKVDVMIAVLKGITVCLDSKTSESRVFDGKYTLADLARARLEAHGRGPGRPTRAPSLTGD